MSLNGFAEKYLCSQADENQYAYFEKGLKYFYKDTDKIHLHCNIFVMFCAVVSFPPRVWLGILNFTSIFVPSTLTF